MTTEQVTVDLPAELLGGIDRLAHNRGRFIVDAVRHELARRRHASLVRSLDVPHPESADFASEGLADWVEGSPAADDGLVDPDEGRAVRWVEGHGWIEPEP